MKYVIYSQHGYIVSTHRTREAAEKKHTKDLAWRCGMCGLVWAGWRRCSCGSQHQVCSAEHYSDRIVVVLNAREQKAADATYEKSMLEHIGDGT